MTKHDYNDIKCFVYPNAYIYADTTKSEHGDYMEVARVVFEPREITYRAQSEIPSELKAQCEKDLQDIKDKQMEMLGVKRQDIEVVCVKVGKNRWEVSTRYSGEKSMNAYRTVFRALCDNDIDEIESECAKYGRKHVKIELW